MPDLTDRVRHQRGAWGDVYEGTKAELIAAGFARAEWFPDPGNPPRDNRGRIRRSFSFEGPHGYEIVLRQQGTGDRWACYVSVSAEEQQRRAAEEHDKRQEQRRRGMSLDYRHDPRADAHAEATIGMAHLARAFNATGNPDIPYRYAPAVIAKFEQLAVSIVELVERGAIEQQRAATAQADAAFQRFMGRAIGGER